MADALNTCPPFDKLHYALHRLHVDVDPLGVQNRAEVEHHGETIERQSEGPAPPQDFHMPVPKVFTKRQLVKSAE